MKQTLYSTHWSDKLHRKVERHEQLLVFSMNRSPLKMVAETASVIDGGHPLLTNRFI
jgi:hypothetical protein